MIRHRRYHRGGLVVAAASVTALVCASCSSSTTNAGGGSSSPPASPSSGTGGPTKGLTSHEAAPMIVQCFIDHHLIPKSALAAGQDGHPPSNSSTWLHDGKVTGNLRFGDWYSNTGSGIAVNGKSIGAWVTAVEASVKAWPTATCGPLTS